MLEFIICPALSVVWHVKWYIHYHI